MQRGILGQFMGARDTLFGTSISPSLALDKLGVCLDRRNFREDVLAERGLYAPDGFPSQTCN